VKYYKFIINPTNYLTMDNVQIVLPENIGKNFIPAEYLPSGKDEFFQRNKQNISPKSGWRNLRSDEVERLVKNDNTADNWDEILVTDQFDTNQIKNTRFYGLVRIGCLRNIILQHHDLRVPAGITNSLIISSDIGDDVAIHNVHYLAHYIIGNRCILFNIQEMHTTDHAKFGNGIIKEGESENVRTWIDLMNETGCRRVLPFDGMITADAYLWAKYIDDAALQNNLKKITQNSIDNHRGFYGTTGDHCVIKNSLILKDVKISSYCYIKGANKLKNLTINSSEEEPSQIGEGVEMVNGIIGYGCHIFYGCKAVKFILGNNSSLKYGARLINSFLGDNSTISCCEVLNNLIFPAHEQHHNNSFLIASVVMGQSNMAAGATIGSNHNSRANDNEIQAGRGFWPGLCTSVKHSCRFASFVLLSKADYPAELNIPLPFSLLNNNVSKDQLEVMPAFWWLYNMYALARNSWKFQNRDKRVHKDQNIEFDPFAPDTIEEIFNARTLLEIWTAKASLRKDEVSLSGKNEDDLARLGRDLLSGQEEEINKLEVLGENMENTKRKVLILKPYKAYHAYGDILHYYATKNLMAYMSSDQNATFSDMCKELGGERMKEWVNLGGQMMQKDDVDKIRSDIGTGILKTWNDIHNRYYDLWIKYTVDKQKHAFATLCELYGIKDLSKSDWLSALDKTVNIQRFVCDQVYSSRKKDFDNPYRQSTFRNVAEMNAAFGTIDENSFIIQVRKETEAFELLAEDIKNRSAS
jgi:NDP-sugar pyrophosphorylase family protein